MAGSATGCSTRGVGRGASFWPGTYRGGSAFSEEEPTLTGGAQASAEAHLRLIGQGVHPAPVGGSNGQIEERAVTRF